MTIHRYEKCIIRLLHNEIINRFEPHLCIDFTGIRCAPSLIVPTVHIYKSKWANGIQIIVRQAKAVQIVFKAFLLVIQISPQETMPSCVMVAWPVCSGGISPAANHA